LELARMNFAFLARLIESNFYLTGTESLELLSETFSTLEIDPKRGPEKLFFLFSDWTPTGP
jgi:hypothetical protein